MLKDIINSIFNPSNDNEYLQKLNEFIFPFKCYLYIVIFLLVLVLISNIYILSNKN